MDKSVDSTPETQEDKALEKMMNGETLEEPENEEEVYMTEKKQSKAPREVCAYLIRGQDVHDHRNRVDGSCEHFRH